MKKLIYPLSFLVMGWALANGPYLRDENHDPDIEMQEEENRKDLHKPGEISETNAEKADSMEKEEAIKDTNQYDPIQDDLENSHGKGDLKGYPIQ